MKKIFIALVMITLFSSITNAESKTWGWIDSFGSTISGWAAIENDKGEINVTLEVFKLKVDGTIPENPCFIKTKKANEERKDVPKNDCRVKGDNHGFSFTIDEFKNAPDGCNYYMVRARAGSKGNWLEGSDTRLAVVKIKDTTFFLRYKKIVSELDKLDYRSGKKYPSYESYPTVMDEEDKVRMWYAGGQTDEIWYASAEKPKDKPMKPFKRWNKAVLSPDTKNIHAKDNHLIADPSVIRVKYKQDKLGEYGYFMAYTAVFKKNEKVSRNNVFLAHSRDGINWRKMTKNEEKKEKWDVAEPFITPYAPENSNNPDYGVGQSSLIWLDQPFGNIEPGILHYFTDMSLTENPGVCMGLHTDGGWNFRRINTGDEKKSNLSGRTKNLGDITWDFKLLKMNGKKKIVGFASYFGGGLKEEDKRKHYKSNYKYKDYKKKYNAEKKSTPQQDEKKLWLRRGKIGIVTSDDGVKFENQIRVDMGLLAHKDWAHQCINNGGLLGNSKGHIEGSNIARTIFYTGAGPLSNMQEDLTNQNFDNGFLLGNKVHLYWNIISIDVTIE